MEISSPILAPFPVFGHFTVKKFFPSTPLLLLISPVATFFCCLLSISYASWRCVRLHLYLLIRWLFPCSLWTPFTPERRKVCCKVNHVLFPYQYQGQKPSLGSFQALSWYWSRCSFGFWAGVWWNVGHCQLKHRKETSMRSRPVPALEVRDIKTETLSSGDFQALFGTPQSRTRALSTPAVAKKVLRCSSQKPLRHFLLIYFPCLRKGNDMTLLACGTLPRAVNYWFNWSAAH